MLVLTIVPWVIFFVANSKLVQSYVEEHVDANVGAWHNHRPYRLSLQNQLAEWRWTTLRPRRALVTY